MTFLESCTERIPQSAAAMKRSDILVQLKFVASTTVTLFEIFMLNFQNNEPTIYEMIDLVDISSLNYEKGGSIDCTIV